jgi:KDO2-lipid IV(A) lauroyltransferase
MSGVRQRVEAGLFGLLLLLARIIPRLLLRAVGAVVGTLGYMLDARHRRIALDNVRLAYGDALTPTEIRRLVRSCWRHFGRMTFESLALTRLTGPAAQRMTEIKGLEHVARARQAGKGYLIFSGHYGHWELGAVVQGFCGYPLGVIARPLDNPALERMLANLRGVSGNRVIHKRNAVREAVRTLRKGGGVAIVIDQDALDNGVFVPFFGRPAATTPTLAALALRMNCPVIPCRCEPLSGGRYRVVVDPPVAVELCGNRADDIVRLTAACTAIIEGWVRDRPNLWLWMHRRWKTRPPN